jgi:hypothetical protein
LRAPAGCPTIADAVTLAENGMASSITALVKDDRLTARVDIRRDGADPVQIEMGAAELDEAIANLANARSRIQPEFSLELQPRDTVLALFDYRWYVEGTRQDGRRTVAFRHPSFGWLAFAMPDRDAANLASWLTKDLPADDGA